ncbi:membrane protein [Sulfolobus acidocaldarius SUSAZ]|nr:membrane protein [Sulfolobus acidocaldarius SUSAZ]
MSSKLLLEAFKIAIRDNLPLLRRYLILGAFDGILVGLSILVSTVIVEANFNTILLGIMSGLIGVAMSSLCNTLVVEIKEKELELRNLERQILKSLKGTIIDYSQKIGIFLNTLVHGLSPFIGVVIIVFYYFSENMWVTIFLSSLILSILGSIYSGEIKERINTAIIMLIAGLVTAALSILLTKTLGSPVH